MTRNHIRRAPRSCVFFQGKPRTKQVTRLLFNKLNKIVFLLALLTCGPSWSFTLDESPSVSGTDLSRQHPSSLTEEPGIPAETDSCLPLLKSARYRNPVPSMERGRPSREQTAMIGLVIGVRFALGPRRDTGRSGRPRHTAEVDVWQPMGTTSTDALAISAYRRCKNEQALQDLSSWRWQR